ncbi:hypothetical protein ACFL04_03765 [Patescibacteria group bacterium]
MKININKPLPQSYRNIFRRLGYSPDANIRSGEESYSKRINQNRYPRFHVYINKNNDQATLNIHLDMKRPSYPGSRAHNAEYSGARVERERDRINEYIENL